MICSQPIGVIAAVVPWNFPLLRWLGNSASAGGRQ